jgi:hypothetical protein
VAKTKKYRKRELTLKLLDREMMPSKTTHTNIFMSEGKSGGKQKSTRIDHKENPSTNYNFSGQSKTQKIT